MAVSRFFKIYPQKNEGAESRTLIQKVDDLCF